MMNNTKYFYLLFGNPVICSQSPIIYKLFSAQTNFVCLYDKLCVEKLNFSSTVFNFFNTHGKGANVTVPFKEEAYRLPILLTKRAHLCQSVNFLQKMKNGKILGDNTDGLGLIYDLKRLNFIKPNNKVLLIGAGGAAKGVVPHLLKLNCSLDIVNRSFVKAQNLALHFSNLGIVRAIDIADLKKLNYNLVINATSLNTAIQFDFFISNVIFYPAKTSFYDLNYSNSMTPFLNWCREHGARYYADGIGMLVSQAAYSFYFWSGIFPKITPVINFLIEDKKYIYKNK